MSTTTFSSVAAIASGVAEKIANSTLSATSNVTLVETSGYTGLLQAFSVAISESSELSFEWDRFRPFITYCCSTYGITCLLMAFILNRTLVLASSNNSRVQMTAVHRQFAQLGGPQLGAGQGFFGHISHWAYLRTELTLAVKLLMIFVLRLVAIGVLAYNGFNVLVALDWTWKLAHEGSQNPYLFVLSTPVWFRSVCRLLLGGFEYDPAWYADLKYMRTPTTEIQVGPTSDMYWPVFVGFCVLLFVETFISVIQCRKPYNESGITLFEHSSAYHQVSARGSLIFGGIGFMLRSRPTEQVLVCSLFLIANHLSSHVGGWLSKTNRFRLIPLAVFGVLFLTYFVSNAMTWGIWGVSYFPVIVTLAYIPQLVFLFIIGVCVGLCLLAYVVNGFLLANLNYFNFIKSEADASNLHGIRYVEWFLLQNFNFGLSDDFYTALLHMGVLMITMVGKLYYIKELGIVTVGPDTWLERELYGYANVIKEPSEWMIKGQSMVGYQHSQSVAKYSTLSVAGRRHIYMSESVIYLTQLGKGLVGKAWNWVSRKKDPENAIPVYLQRYVQPKDDAAVETEWLEVDELNEEQLTSNLLLKELSSTDNSGDYKPNGEERYDLDYEDLETENDEGEGDEPFDELVKSAGEFADMVESEELRFHMHSKATGVMTRSQFSQAMHVNGGDDATKLAQLILQKRERWLQTEEKARSIDKAVGDDDEDDLEVSKYDCVVCQCNPREIITWPCKCFAICEGCRVSLVVKGMEGCVICRKNVDGVTRVFIP